MRLNILFAVLFAALGFFQYRLWFESGGISEMLKIKKKLVAQVQENDVLKKQNEKLLFQIRRLQNSHDATESRARSELGMIKKNETFYQVVK